MLGLQLYIFRNLLLTLVLHYEKLAILSIKFLISIFKASPTSRNSVIVRSSQWTSLALGTAALKQKIK